ATGDLAGQLQRGLDGVVAGRAGELDLVVEAPRFEDDVLEGFQELAFGSAVRVQAVHDLVVGQVVDELALQLRVVVPVVEGAGPGEEVQVGLAALVVDVASEGLVENDRPATAVSADFGLEALEGLHRVFLGSFPQVRGLMAWTT